MQTTHSNTYFFITCRTAFFKTESLKTNSTMTKHTIKSARYMWNYVIELTFDDDRVAAFDFERIVKDAYAPAAVAKYAKITTFRDNATIGNPKQLAWHDDMVFDANWLYALMPDAVIEMFSSILPTTISVNCKF